MKKIYVLGLTLCAFAHTFAQMDTVNFESILLNSNSHNNGADLSGGFTENGVFFSNYYDTTYQYFTGFAISNESDVTTAGFSNQYSSFAGGGDNSSNFSVYYPGGVVDLGTGINYLVSLRVTNTTFAALSMMFGDSYGKKFGDSTSANGILDGTNGEDFFKLKIYSLTTNNDTVGFTEIFLADYRFADSTQDYILDQWTTVDLLPLNSAIGNARYLQFELESSDNGSFGMNTPAYFALDNLVLDHNIVGLEENKPQVLFYPNPIRENLFVKNAYGHMIITDNTGKVIFQSDINGEEEIRFADFANGIYFIRLLNDKGEFIQKVIK